MAFFSFIYDGKITKTSKKVIPENEYSVLMDAKEVLEKAKEDAKKYLEENEKKCQKLREKAKEKGKQEGLVQFNEKILFFDQQLKKIKYEVQQKILFLVINAAKKIVGKELELNPGIIIEVVNQTLKAVIQSHHIKIFANKEDIEILEKNKKDLKKQLEQIETFSILEKDDIEKGGCIIETESGIINASLKNQWKALEIALKNFMAPKPS